MRVLVIGDLAVDISGLQRGHLREGENVLLDGVRIRPGGVAGNLAFYLRGLGSEVYVAGSVGRDPWGDFILRDLRSMGAGTELVRIVRRPTGFFVIAISPGGERTMIGSRGANEDVRISSDQIKGIRPDWIHLSGYTLLNRNRAAVLRAVKESALELGVRYSVDLEGIGEMGAALDLSGAVVFCNEGRCSERSKIGRAHV
jgi:ribokinase